MIKDKFYVHDAKIKVRYLDNKENIVWKEFNMPHHTIKQMLKATSIEDMRGMLKLYLDMNKAMFEGLPTTYDDKPYVTMLQGEMLFIDKQDTRCRVEIHEDVEVNDLEELVLSYTNVLDSEEDEKYSYNSFVNMMISYTKETETK